MDIACSRSESCTVLTLAGELDGRSAGGLVEAVRAELGSTSLVVVNFESVAAIDSSGLEGLLAIDREARERGVELALSRLAPRVRKFLQLMGLLGRFESPGESSLETLAAHGERVLDGGVR